MECMSYGRKKTSCQAISTSRYSTILIKAEYLMSLRIVQYKRRQSCWEPVQNNNERQLSRYRLICGKPLENQHINSFQRLILFMADFISANILMTQSTKYEIRSHTNLRKLRIQVWSARNTPGFEILKT